MRKLLLILVILTLFGCINSSTDDRIFPVSVYLTSGDRSALLALQDELYLQQDIPDKPLGLSQVLVDVNEDVLFQEIDGFGAALTESSAYLINSLPHDKRTQVLEALFLDIRMNFIRLPMGASDFALSSYTYNDLPEGQTDENLEHFSIARDEEHVIPILKDAFKLNPQIKLMGSPWSAPAWMKTSGDLNHGSLKPEYYKTYSQYFVKFIKVYEAHSLPIYAITPQNEPLHEAWSYPSMKMTNDEQLNFIKVLGPTFKENNIDTKIIVYDHNWDKRQYPYKIYNDSVASQYVAGSAFHCYAGDVEAQAIVNQIYPDKGIWFTECSGGKWSENFANNLEWNMENLFIGAINNHSKSVLLWNIALDENHGPQNGGCENCRGVLTITSDGKIYKNVEYYVIGHLAKFVEPGARRIETTISGNNNLLATAFKNLDGNVVIVMYNKGNNQLKVTIKNDGLKTQYTIPRKSASTLVINKNDK